MTEGVGGGRREGERAGLRRALYRYRWAIFAILTAAYFFVYFHRMSVGIVGRDIVDDVGGTVGLLSSVYFWTYAAMQIPSGLLADHLGPRRATTIFLLIAAAGSFLTFAGTEFWEIVLGKVLIAAGMAVIYIPLMKVVSVWFGKADFPQLAGIVIAVGNVGAIAASAPLEMMAEALGWRGAFLVLGAVTLALALLCAAFVRDHPHRKGLPAIEELEAAEGGASAADATDARMPMLKGLAVVASGGRRFWPMALAYFLVYGSIMVFQGTWAAIYFKEVYGFGASAALLVTALGVGKIISTAAIGVMSGRGVIRSKRTAMLWGTAAYAAVWGVIWALAGQLESYWFWMAVCFAFGVSGGFMTLSFTQVKEWYPTAISGTSVSAMNVFLFLGASVCTTVTAPIMGTSYTLGNFSLVWALMLAASLLALLMVALSVEKGEGDPFVGAGERGSLI
ncbi:MAG: MFS transporter [Methanomassiliicoccaceae archaeon]|nr:MFS transporter [Methanomassiliicoccaceae archaeon]